MQCKFQNLHCILRKTICKKMKTILQKWGSEERKTAFWKKKLHGKVIIQAKSEEGTYAILQFFARMNAISPREKLVLRENPAKNGIFADVCRKSL